MIRYFIKRLITSLLVIWGVLTLSFIFLHLAPGDPTSIYIRPEIPPEAVQIIRRKMGLDLPIWQQYLHWLYRFSFLDFGLSYSHMEPVAVVLKEGLKNTLQLTSAVFLLQFLIGTWLGIFLGKRSGTARARVVHGVLLILFSAPSFWLGLMAILLFSLKLGWLPSSQMQSFGIDSGPVVILLDRIRHLLLPVAVLAIPFIAITAKMIAAKTEDLVEENFVKAAKAFGLSERIINRKYIGRNLMPLLANIAGLYLPFLLGGSVIIESIFGLPGMGRITVNALFAHDYPLILAGNFLAAVAVVSGNLMADLIAYWVDPRLRICRE